MPLIRPLGVDVDPRMSGADTILTERFQNTPVPQIAQQRSMYASDISNDLAEIAKSKRRQQMMAYGAANESSRQAQRGVARKTGNTLNAVQSRASNLYGV